MDKETFEGTSGEVFELIQDDSPTDTIDLKMIFPCPACEEMDSAWKHEKSAFIKLLSALSVPTLLISRSHAIKFANPAFAKLTNGRLHTKNLTFSSLFSNPLDARQAQLLLEKVFNERKQEIREKVLQIHRTRIWARIHLLTVRNDDEELVLVQIENLTAQKELLTVQKYKKLVNVFPLGIVELATPSPLSCGLSTDVLLKSILNSRVVDGNNEFAHMYQRRDFKELKGVRLDMIFPSRGKSKSLYQKWIAAGFPVRSFETRETMLMGGIHYFENTLIGNINNGLLYGFWWLKKDISEKKRNEEEIIKAQKIDSLGILAGGIAHDFNNLLTGILGNITLAQKLIDPDHTSHKRLDYAAKASVRAQDLTRQLLTFSRGGAPIKKPTCVPELLQESVGFALRGSNVDCEFYLPLDVWSVEVDEGQINQVVNNIVINAVQAMPDGGTMQVRAMNTVVSDGQGLPLKSGKYVKISIVDEGTGIPEEHIDKIFDPYFTTKKRGSGLGLATCYSVIKKHDGYINVKSEVGAGTTFDLYLPVSGRVSETNSEDEKSVKNTKGKILIMDDEELIRDLAIQILMVAGYEVVPAKDGTEAIAIFENALRSGQPFAAVIMDLTIPGGMGGKETIRRLLRIDPQVKAIVSSGYSNDPVMAEFAFYGFKGVLEKPYNAEELSKALNAVLTPGGE
ncbi:hybrid sensor histidine kinase/response regulator [Desulfomonile tiedjei]|uniref:histidine kinase n=1 Tax=Desulfomonile tiedjei (strain ATCC 49306 / DSM 6799 / DCB-1) TaxID=706587 RepID=I4CD27_DESTA|nr:PAS domain-containing hybrid sensor histidine kinase/response regulator [Desulfomonile tiedjei]AFM27468.1 signal transduction histidine kinase [Desulfomonile tiedjei DSM 6799]